MTAVTADTYRRRPCAACPWRADADLTAFTDGDMERLAAADVGRTDRPYGVEDLHELVAAPRMSCHLDQPGTRHAMRLCAGWLAVVGPHHVATRTRIALGALPADAVEPGPGWPDLHDGLAALLAARAAQLAPMPPVNPTRQETR